MERIVETPAYKIQDGVEVLVCTMIQTYNDITEIVGDEEVIVSTLIETKRLMVNGDYYIITGNIEEFCPVVPVVRPLTAEEKNKANTQSNYGLLITMLGAWG